MEKYFMKAENTVKLDELFGGGDGFPVETKNVTVASDTNIFRGSILASATDAGTYSLATAADTGKSLVIAAEDFVADSDNTVTTAYSAGKFNRERLIADTDTTITALETELRRQNIILTSIKN